MAFKEVSSLDAEVTIAIGKKDKKTGKAYPKQAEGYYLGSRQVESKRGNSFIHFLQTENGNLGVWGTTDLNRKLGAAPLGSMVRVTSTGTKPTPNGDMYTYKVEVDADNTIEVANLTAGSSTAGNEAYDDQDSLDEDGNEDNNVTEEDDTAAQLAAAAERKAKVQALLNNKGKR